MFGDWRVLSSAIVRKRGSKWVSCCCTLCGVVREVNSYTLTKKSSTRCITCSAKASRKARDMQRWGRIPDEADLVLQVRWNAIWHRCNNPKSNQFFNYGGRGVTLAPEFYDYVKFVDHVRALPDCPNPITRKDTVDRIDVNRGYEPGNLRFATQREQMRNLRTTCYITHNGTTYDAQTFCDTFCHNYRPHVVSRLVRQGATAEQILDKDVNDKHVGRRWGRTCV